MSSNLPAAVRATLAQRNAEHMTVYSMLCNEAEILELAEGRVPESVQAMARMLSETDDVLFERMARRRRRWTAADEREWEASRRPSAPTRARARSKRR